MFSQISKYINQIRGFNYSFEPLLHNRFVLYFVLILALIDLFYFTIVQDYFSIATFLLVGFLTSFFSKNMVVIMVLGLILTHVLRFGEDGDIQEGMTGDNSDETDDTLPKSTAKATTPAKVTTAVATTTPAKATTAVATTTPAKATTAVATTTPKATTIAAAKATATAALEQSAEVKQQLLDFSELQRKIISNIGELNKLSEQADTFMNKFESYKNKVE